jgi:hypothetical protein
VTRNFVPEETLDLLALGSSSWLKIDRKNLSAKGMFLYVFPKAKGQRYEEIKYIDFIGGKTRITVIKYNEMHGFICRLIYCSLR